MKTEPPIEAQPTIDTSKMPREQREALELTEAAREVSRGGFASGLFMGRFDFGLLHPYPDQSTADREQGDAFLDRLGALLRDRVDPDEIDSTGEIPQHVFD